KFQLKMLSVSAFDPLSRSMGPMLKEESYHLGTGNNGLLRIVKAGKMPPEVIQRFFYKWIPTAFDLFGTDNSSSAHWAYVWGLKGRYDERENPLAAFCAAAGQGADGVEIDVHATIDGEIVVHHDPSVLGLPIAQARWRDLATVPLANGEPIPTLAQALDVLGKLKVFVEVKV